MNQSQLHRLPPDTKPLSHLAVPPARQEVNTLFRINAHQVSSSRVLPLVPSIFTRWRIVCAPCAAVARCTLADGPRPRKALVLNLFYSRDRRA